nr:hypothetical protein [Tanacetum cinerariifolium]
MASFDYRLNPLYPIKECSSYGDLYTTNYCCSDGSPGDKIIFDLDKTPDLSQRPPHNCPKCGNSVDDSSEPSNDNTNIVNALQEPFVVKQEPGKNSSQSTPQINHHCCYGCGDSLEDIFCHQCSCKLCGRDGKSFTYDSTSSLVHESPNDFHPPLQPPTYSYEFCGNDAYYSHDCSLQVPFTYDPESCYNQDFNLPQNFQIFQQYPYCTRCGGPHETCQCNQLIFDDPYCENCGGPHMNFQCQPMNQNHYEPNPCSDSNSFGFDQFHPPQFPVIHQPFREKTCAELLAEKQEANINTQPFQYSVIPQPPQEEMSVEFLHEKRNQMEYVKTFLRKFNRISFYEMPKVLSLAWEIILEIELAFEDKHCQSEDILDDDDDEDYTIAVTSSLSINEPDNSLSMRDKHLDTVLAMESDEFIKSSVESLVPIPSEFEGIPENMCDMSFHDNSSPLDVSKDQFKDFSNSNDDSTSTDDDSFPIDNIEYVEASPPDSELSSSTSLNSLLEETNTFDNSLPVSETFYFDLEEISSGSITTGSGISLPEYEASYDDHVKEISSGSMTTHSDSSLYDLFIFDLSINPFPPADRSDFYEFTDELARIISPPEYDCFYFKNEPNSGDFIMDVVEDTFPTREPRVHNALPTHPTLHLNMDFILYSESFLLMLYGSFFLSLIFSCPLISSILRE